MPLFRIFTIPYIMITYSLRHVMIALILHTLTLLSKFHHHGCLANDDGHGIMIASVVADTTQILYGHELDSNPKLTLVMKRHHLVCFQTQKQQKQQFEYNKDDNHGFVEARELCCSDIHRSGFFTKRHDLTYCLDRIALVPTNSNCIHGNARVGGEKLSTLDNLVPKFYLSWDDEKKSEVPINSFSTDFYYNQLRRVKVLDEAGRESFRDEFASREVAAHSPFHVPDFVSSEMRQSNRITYPLRGYVEGSLSNEGGMHRSYRQRVNLIMDFPLSNDDIKLSGPGSKMNVNATVFLPISENIFIDADDPLNAEYENGTLDGIFCRISFGESKMSQDNFTRCNIQFVSPEIIDIEQPSFASRQYVVAFELSAELVPLVPNEISEDPLVIVLDYCTTLHFRYPLPISRVSRQAGNDGVVPITIHQPILHSATVSVRNNVDVTDKLFLLQTDVNAPIFSQPASILKDVIIIRVAAGLDHDLKWVTIFTLSLAMLGGFVLVRSLDLISIWC